MREQTANSSYRKEKKAFANSPSEVKACLLLSASCLRLKVIAKLENVSVWHRYTMQNWLEN